MRRTAVISILALALAAAAACGPARLKRANLLLDDVRGYHDGVRWGKLAQAAVRLPPKQRDAFVDEREQLADELRIADYELVRVRYLDGKMRAKVRVQYVWHLDSRGIVHKTWADEIWQRRGKRWILEKEHRAHGEQMPGLAEPPEEEKADKNADENADETKAATAPVAAD